MIRLTVNGTLSGCQSGVLRFVKNYENDPLHCRNYTPRDEPILRKVPQAQTIPDWSKRLVVL